MRDYSDILFLLHKKDEVNVCTNLPQVNRIVTSKRVSIILVCVFIIFIGSGTPIYFVNRLDYKFFPDRNKTLIGLVYTADRDVVEKVSYAINNTFIPLSSFAVNVVCTVTLVVKLQKVTRWRQKSSATLQADNISIRNHKVTRMVIMISTLFIACFVPVSITFMAMSLLPGLSFEGEYRNALIIIGGLGIVLESVNSSVNIFFYYHMSSKYKSSFRQLFRVYIDGS